MLVERLECRTSSGPGASTPNGSRPMRIRKDCYLVARSQMPRTTTTRRLRSKQEIQSKPQHARELGLQTQYVQAVRTELSKPRP